MANPYKYIWRVTASSSRRSYKEALNKLEIPSLAVCFTKKVVISPAGMHKCRGHQDAQER